MTGDTRDLSPLDRAVLLSLTLVAVALIIGAIVRNDSTYLGYLAGPGTLGALYVLLAR